VVVDSQVSYCACAYNRSGNNCYGNKPSTGCESTTGIVAQLTNMDKKRFVHIRIKQTGSIYARHVVPNLQTCVRLCEWAGPNNCRSINYGTVNEVNMCELISVQANELPLSNWLNDDDNWTYYCCFD